MFNELEIFNIYNYLSNQKIDIVEFGKILPKLHLILKNVKIDNIESIELIDVLLEFKSNGVLDNITEESLKVVKKIVNNGKSVLESTVYFPLMIKHILLPYNLNKCQNEKEILLFLLEFEILLELASKTLDQADYEILWKYNKELMEVVLEYKKSIHLYQEKVANDIILDITISHLSSIFYFYQDQYEKKESLIYDITKSLVENYQELIVYYYNEGIKDNFFNLFVEHKNLEKEYEVSKKMLDYEFNKYKEKRKCK